MRYGWLLETEGERSQVSFDDRLVLDEGSLTGAVRHLDLGHGLNVFTADVRTHGEARLTTSDEEAPEAVSSYVTVEGRCLQELPDADGPQPMDDQHSAMFRTRVRRADYAFAGGTRLRSLAYSVDPERLLTASGGTPSSALAALLTDESPPGGGCRYRTLPNDRVMRRLAREVLEQSYARDLERLFVESRVLEVLLHQCERLAATADWRPTQPTRDSRVREAAAWIEERLHDPPTVAALAAAVGLSERQLELGFRRRFGVTVFAYLRDARLDAAYRALAAEALPLRVVAQRVGYANASNFANAFRRRFGIPPGQVRVAAASASPRPR